MFLIATKFIMLLAIAYLFGLLVAWLFSFFNDNDGGDDRGNNDPDTPKPPQPGRIAQPKNRKRLVEVDESYYLEEFDLSKKQ
jgi:hypothetical protein